MVHRNSAAGFARERLERLRAAIQQDIERDRYFGAVVAVARHGTLAFLEALGHADAARQKALGSESVFSLFSVTKAFTNTLVFRALELGQLALTTRVSAVIPEFSGGLRETINFYHLLTHCSGLPSVFTPRPGMYIDRLDEIVAAVVEHVQCEAPPGERVTYAPMAAHALMGEAVHRLDPARRSYRRLVEEEIFAPLGMRDSAIGVRRDLRARHVVPHFLDASPIEHLGHSNLGPNGAFEEEHAEMPWVGAVATVPDLLRFAEMFRRGGELDGVRILSPAIIGEATRNRTGERPNELYRQLTAPLGWPPYPAYIGLGFFLRGEAICPHQFGTLSSPRTFGNTGYGSTLFWVDPQRDISFVCLSAGVMSEPDNIERFQRLSDIVVAAAT